MSKIIKRSALGKPVLIGKTPRVRTFDPPELVKKPGSSRNVLAFRHRIESSIAFWRDRASNHLMTIEEDRKAELEQTYGDGYAKGRTDGAEEEHASRADYIDTRFGNTIKDVDALLDEARRVQSEAAGSLDRKIVDLAIAIAETLIKRSIETDPSIIEDIVHESMAQIISSEKLILKVSADDYEVINEHYDRWFGMAGNAREFRIEVDRRLAPGDCLIETEGGIIDATVRSRLDLISGELVRVQKQ